ncbi:ABC transporter permease [Modestobacter excelsi]|uniref:ABC transporter permease n=1 Tax=Modestobacter excelsi TaxID=2213161 RepID=UPI00110CE229|nr:ABC transporter permease [Modestobacter excelsi]
MTLAERLHCVTCASVSSDRGPGWTVNSPTGRLTDWGELWRAREVMGFFALRDLRVRYKQAVLGAAWVVVQPLVTVAVFTLVFDRLADVDTRGVPYVPFALAGLLGWTYVSQCVSRGSEALVANSSLVTKVYIPRLTAPVASLLPPFVDLLVGLGLLAIVCAIFGAVPSVALLLLPVWVLLLALTALGPTCFLAAVNVRFRDARQLVPTALQALLFASPVAYSAASVHGVARYAYALNPMVGVLEFGRFVLIGGPWPGTVLAVSTAVAVLMLAAGVRYFLRASRAFADVI